ARPHRPVVSRASRRRDRHDHHHPDFLRHGSRNRAGVEQNFAALGRAPIAPTVAHSHIRYVARAACHITHRGRSIQSCIYIYGTASIYETCVTGVMVSVAIFRRSESRTMLRTTSAESNWKNPTCREATGT